MKPGKMVMGIAVGAVLAFGVVHAAEDQQDMPPMGGPEGNIKIMDTDKDGKVSQDEYLAHARQRAERLFKMLDSNGDGFLTKDEFQAGRKRVRERMQEKRSQHGTPAMPQRPGAPPAPPQ